MNINDNFSTNIRISVKDQDGKVVREITKTNKLTFQGADIIAAAISQRGVLDLTGLYIRYAQNEADAKATEIYANAYGDCDNCSDKESRSEFYVYLKTLF